MEEKSKSRSKYQYFFNLTPFIRQSDLLIIFLLFIPFFLLGINIWGLENKPLFWQQHFGFDAILLESFHESIPGALGNFLKITYILTGSEVTAFIVAAFLIYFTKKRYFPEATVLAFSTLSILLTNDNLIKPFFLRLRPEDWLVEVTGRSFPSGHVMGNTLLYFYVAYILSYYYPQQRKLFYWIAGSLLFVISISTLYVRVHWITDIIAGYAVGYVWLVVSLAVLRWMDKKYRYKLKRVG